LTIDDALKVKLLCDYYFCKSANKVLGIEMSAIKSKPSAAAS
jgi:hypothetical protein